MRFLHTMIRVGDLERSIAFYTDVMGMTLLRRSENPEYQYSLAFLGYEGGNPALLDRFIECHHNELGLIDKCRIGMRKGNSSVNTGTSHLLPSQNRMQ